jgi:hypothetical protein
MRKLIKTPWLLIMFVSLSLTFLSCNDSLTNGARNKKANIKTQARTSVKTSQTKLSLSQKKLKEKLKASALLMRQVLSKPKARKEVRDAINYYTNKKNNLDERVYIVSLFNKGATYRKAARKQNESEFFGSFANTLNKDESNLIKVSNTNYTVKKLEAFQKSQNISLYFPYHENWKNKKVVPTITYNPLDNEYINEGWKPVIKNGKIQDWEKVKVDDHYAENNPTMIVEPCDAGPNTDPCDYIGPNYVGPKSMKPCPNGCGGGGGGGGGSSPPPAPGPPCNAGESCAHYVQIGWAKITHNFDGIFGGGSLIKWVMADAAVTSDNHVQTHTNLVSFHFTRQDAKHGRWKQLFSQIDDNWEGFEKAKDFKIYEADGGSLTSIKLGVEVKVGPIDGKFNATFKFGHNRNDIFRTFYHRNVFFADNNSSDGVHGLKDGVRIRYVNHVYWTMPITKIGL